MDSKKDDFDIQSEIDGGDAPRARNRTVMLTPEMTGQLRSRMGREGIIPKETEEKVNLQDTQPIGNEHVHSANNEQASSRFAAPRAVQPTNFQAQQSEFYSMAQEDTVVARHENIQKGHLTNKTPANATETDEFVLKDAMYWSKASPIVGFLVSYDNEENGESFELRQGRVIVTSEKAAHGDYFVIADETVSPMHAILRITSTGEVQVLDQLSEFGTKIKRLGFDETEDLSGERSPVGHGDVLWFGKRSFHVCMVVRQRQ